MKRRKKVEWTRLDNAAKIFPPTSNEKDTKVFRFSCELFEEVDPALLGQALDEAVEAFPIYKSVLRRGFFWYYLETGNLLPVVKEECEPVCGRIYHEDRRSLLFRVFYYKNRINIETFHALSDGTGALLFMKTVLYGYLVKKHKNALGDNRPVLDYDASMRQKMDDSFLKYYTGRSRRTGGKRVRAYHIKGSRRDEFRMQVIEGVLSVKEVLKVAHEYNTTMTVFLTALFMYSICKGMTERGKKHPVVISVPVNLRQYFESESARNFFSTINVSYDFGKQSPELTAVIDSVSESFKRELTQEQLKEQMNRLAALEHNLFTRAVPLVIKDITLKAANILNEGGITAALSNIGKISVAKELTPYIRQFSVYTSARRPQICMCSYGDVLTISFTSPYTDTDIQKNFFQSLAKKGIPVVISTNL